MDFIPGNDYSEWQILGEEDRSRLYQQVTVQEPMGWSGLSLDCYRVACGKFSGPIALKWNSDETLPMNCDIKLTIDILIYDSCGKKIAQIPGEDWQYTRVATMGWSSTEKLFFLFEDGKYVIFSNNGDILTQDKIFTESLSDVVLSASTCDDGFVAFTKNNKVIYVDCSGEYPETVYYPDLPLVAGNRVECSCVYEARNNESHKPEFIVCCMDQSLYLVTIDSVNELNIIDHVQGQIIAFAASPSNDYIACFSDQGWLDVFDRYFENHIVGKNTDCRVPPRGFAWCGDDSVVLYWRSVGLLVINPFADWLKYTYDKDDTLFLVPEIDCLRVYSSLKHEIIRCVPPAISSVYLPESNSNGAILRHSHEQFIHHDGNVSLLRGETREERQQLSDGVLDCLEAAEDELSTIQQEELLRSAQFGKCFLDGANLDDNEEEEVSSRTIVKKFQEVCHLLRVLNMLRDPKIAMYLTARQYLYLGPEEVIHRLMCRHHYYLAIKVSKYLSISPHSVLIYWACQKIRHGQAYTDDVLRDQIRENIKDYSTISYRDIAKVACEVGRTRLATMLLEFEPRRSDRIPLLLQMGEIQLALRTATNSNNSDLMMMVAMTLYDKTSDTISDKLLDLLKHFPAIFNSWLFYLHLSDVNKELSVMNILGRCDEVINILIKNAFQEMELSKRKEALKRIIPICETAISAGRKDITFYETMIKHEITLLDYKLKLVAETKCLDCANYSLIDTIHYAIVTNRVHMADAMAKAFKVPDKRYWRVKINGLAEAGSWDDLHNFGDKRSPIGYSPFVEVCMINHNQREAAHFNEKMNDTSERLQCAMKWQLYEVAIPAATKLKDVDTLMRIINESRADVIRKSAKQAIALIEGSK